MTGTDVQASGGTVRCCQNFYRWHACGEGVIFHRRRPGAAARCTLCFGPYVPGPAPRLGLPDMNFLFDTLNGQSQGRLLHWVSGYNHTLGIGPLAASVASSSACQRMTTHCKYAPDFLAIARMCIRCFLVLGVDNLASTISYQGFFQPPGGSGVRSGPRSRVPSTMNRMVHGDSGTYSGARRIAWRKGALSRAFGWPLAHCAKPTFGSMPR